MKTRTMFYLVLAALFVFAGNPFAMGEPVDAMEAPPEIEAPVGYDEVTGRQGTEGPYNTFYGINAGAKTTGKYNSFFGRSAGYENTSGTHNSFFGYLAGHNNTEGASNSFFGTNAGYNNEGGGANSFFGRSAGFKNTSGDNNSFFGRSAGYENTSGTFNSFFGLRAGNSNNDGDFNSFFGYTTGDSNISGGANSFFGYGAGSSNISGDHNSFFGGLAGHENTTGSGNVFLGYQAGYNETDSHKLYIDSTDTPTPLIWGDFNTNEVKINGGFKANASSMSSDRRWKKNIKLLESSLDKISSLQGVSYEWKTDEYPDVGMAEGKQIGLVAQDVESVLPELVSKDKDGYKAVSYTKLTAVLVEAVKELKAENQRQKELIEEQRIQSQKQQVMFEKQQAEIEELSSMIKELKG